MGHDEQQNYEEKSHASEEQGICPFAAISNADADIVRYFTDLKIESEYLKDLLARTVKIILRSYHRNDLTFGSVVEGPTIAGGIAEVTNDRCIRIDTDRLRQYEDTVAMALLAHELAHDHLRHFKTWKNNLDDEYSADNLAKTWGFNIDQFRKTCGLPGMNSRLQQIAVII